MNFSLHRNILIFASLQSNYLPFFLIFIVPQYRKQKSELKRFWSKKSFFLFMIKEKNYLK